MPKRAKQLSAIEVKRLSTPGQHAVGGVAGLALCISEKDGCSWILRFTMAGARREMGLGPYPEVSLAIARQLAIEAKSKVSTGIDPIDERKEARFEAEKNLKQRVTFSESFERFYLEKLVNELKNIKHAKQWKTTLESYAFPEIGSKLVSEVNVDDIISILKPIWSTKTETASRVQGRIAKVLDWAKASGYRDGENPARWQGNLDQILPSPQKIKKIRSQPAVQKSELSEWFGILKSREGVGAQALQFLSLTAARSGEVRGAKWEEIDVQDRIWTVPAERMKLRREHRVPLSDAALSILTGLPRFLNCPLVFPGSRGQTMSDMTLSAVMKRINQEQLVAGRTGFIDSRSKKFAVPHGIRSSFRDWAAEETSFPRELAEMALAHKVGNDVELAYRRTDMVERRRQLMNDWADFLLGSSQKSIR